MAKGDKVLILDDDQDVLDTYRELLASLPSHPEIYTANSGSRALVLLESEPFDLLITDLKMPKIDGFQVLMMVRRKFPALRTVVITGVLDEQYRARAYAMGIDLFIEKPTSPTEIKSFTDCIESLLGQGELGGFRGVQSKSLIDLIQLECLTQSSSVLKVANGSLEGRIWIQNGELIDAVAQGKTGEAAFREILGWKGGNFEILPAQPTHARQIFTSYQGLLLESVQSQDEATADFGQPAKEGRNAPSGAAALARAEGVELALIADTNTDEIVSSWGLESSEQTADWLRETLRGFNALGERLRAGQLDGVEGFGSQRHLAIQPRNDKFLCIGFKRALTPEEVRAGMKTISAKWES